MRNTTAILIGVPFIIVGLLLCATVILFPIGFILMVIGSIPLARLQHKRVQEQFKAHYKAPVKANREDEPLPEWVVMGLPENKINKIE